MHRHVALYRNGGEAALMPRRRGPKVSPKQTPAAVEEAVVRLCKQLSELGFDAGARSIAFYLAERGVVVPGRATIHRILVRRCFVVAQPQKPPRSSWQRFEASLPSECWQSDNGAIYTAAYRGAETGLEISTASPGA